MPMTRDQAIERHRASREKLDDAIKAVHSAIVGINSATLRAMHDQVRLVEPAERRNFLISEAAMNNSGWSGGPLNAQNLIEAAKRAAALDLLRRPPPDIDPTRKENTC